MELFWKGAAQSLLATDACQQQQQGGIGQQHSGRQIAEELRCEEAVWETHIAPRCVRPD